ncbi:hypothetical protein BC936DRAFT_145878 [Jimgerdemannia flammicorona]|uniref:Gamma-secretase-activating protein C-terminal domain-containing protein n=1 Tax=Jimgerdemannia flammicorona TaxID=994334 RepID=A0A433DNC1_9FUNG|nr:hypothetical protein BC936DRAFT_145878 [Jimgerdemannia flammicorona]RUP52353.1 hypothetical protein BC936DRAFT_145878 [Jimgerdemannia flammicorona]
MLFVYLPGSSFMLVDCMDSYRTLIAHVEDIKSTNPNGKPPHAATLLLVGDYQLPSDGVCLLDTTTRIAHRARLSRDPAAVLATAARNDPGGLACLLRVWARYMLGEEEVMTEIIRKVCTRATSLEYADVWKEYLIGMGYRAVVSSCTDPDILAQLPFSIRKRKQYGLVHRPSQALRDMERDPPLSPGFQPDPVVSTSTTVSELSSLNPSLNGRPSHRRTNSQSCLPVSVSVTQVSAQGEFQRTLSLSGSDTPSSPARNKPVSLPAKVPSSPSTSSWRPMSIPSFPSLMPSVSHSTPLSWMSSTATLPSPSTTQESTSKEEACPRSPTIASGSSYFKTDMRRTKFFPTYGTPAEIEVGRGRGISQLTPNARRLSPPRCRTTLQGPFPSVEFLAKHNVEELTIRQRLMDILVENVADYIMAWRGFTESQTVRAKAVEAVGAFVRGQIQQSNHLWTTMDETRHILRFSDFATCRCWNCGVLQHRHRRHGSTTTPTSFLTHISSSFSESPRKIDIALAPTTRAATPVTTPMARQDSYEGMFYFEPSDMYEDADGTKHEVGEALRRVGRVAVVFPVVSPEPEPERRAESLVLQQAAAREDRASEVAILREHVHAYKLLEGMYRALHELGLPFPEGFHTAFAVAGFHTMTRR